MSKKEINNYQISFPENPDLPVIVTSNFGKPTYTVDNLFEGHWNEMNINLDSDNDLSVFENFINKSNPVTIKVKTFDITNNPDEIWTIIGSFGLIDHNKLTLKPFKVILTLEDE